MWLVERIMVHSSVQATTATESERRANDVFLGWNTNQESGMDAKFMHVYTDTHTQCGFTV